MGMRGSFAVIVTMFVFVRMGMPMMFMLMRVAVYAAVRMHMIVLGVLTLDRHFAGAAAASRTHSVAPIQLRRLVGLSRNLSQLRTEHARCA